MEYIIYGVIAILLIWFLAQNILPAKGVEHITTSDLKKIVRNKNYQFVDVRTPMEFQGNHIKGFKNIPVSQIKQRFGELKKDKNVVLICQTGSRSNKAARALKKLGFSNVINVQGGMTSWMQ